MSGKFRLGFLARPVQYLIFFLSGFFPRNSELWVFGAWGGNRLPGNAAAVFRFVDSHPETRVPPVWISSNADVRNILRAEGRRAYHPWSPRGVVTCLRAGVYIYDVCGNNINYWLSRKAHNVLLRHGTGIKKVGRTIDNPAHHLHRLYHGNIWQRMSLGFLLPWHNTTYALVIASSDQHALQATEFFFVDQKDVAVTGSPRTDAIFDASSTHTQDPAVDWIRTRLEAGRRVCLYMPTFRDDRTRAFPHPWRTLDDICARTNTSVLVRLHPVDRSNAATDEIAQLEHLRMHGSKEDPALLFPLIDGLITDYSSVVYDFMLLEKPAIFFCPDLAHFIENSRNLYFDLQDVTPGPVAQDLAQLEAALDDLSSGALDRMPFEDDYQKTLGLFHKYKDGNSSQRVWREIQRRFCPSAPDGAR